MLCEDGEHFTIDSGAIVTGSNRIAAVLIIHQIMRHILWLMGVDFQPVNINTPYDRRPFGRLLIGIDSHLFQRISPLHGFRSGAQV